MRVRGTQALLRQLGRLRVRLLIVNLVVVLVPIAGLEFADLYERQLLGALERDMRNQAVVVRRFLEADLRRDIPLGDPAHQEALEQAAEKTRTRIRLLDRSRAIVADSHRDGPPEGPEPPPPTFGSTRVSWSAAAGPRWPDPPERREVQDAFRGARSSYTRIRNREPAVLLFLAEPVMPRRRVEGVVYVVRSSRPVLGELHRIRSGLLWVLGAAVLFTLLVTLALAWSISRPISRLSRAAKRIASGERDVAVPVGGSGEVRELGESFASMTDELQRRLEYISDFAADVAHEFKSPLTSIRGAAELLAEGAAEDPVALERFLRNILADTERLDRLVSRLLQLSRIEAASTTRELVLLEPIVRAIAERHPGKVEVRFDSSAPLLAARESDLRTAILNLVDNAVRFSPESEAVTLTVRDAKHMVEIAVRDRGPGVPEANREKIFDRFFTTDSEKQGTGLGLAIVKAVAEAHGGGVRLESPDDGGARFVLSLPAARA